MKNKHPSRYLLGLAVTAALMAGPSVAGGDGGDAWPYAGQNLSNTRSSETEHKISPQTASSLSQRWVFTTGGDVSATPSVEGGALYVPDWGGNLFRINAETGVEEWARTITGYNGLQGSVSRTTPAVAGNKLIIGDQDGNVMAIDKNTGNLMWKTRPDDHPAAIITQSPVVQGNRVYVGVSSSEEGLATDPNYPCCSFRGSIVALDLSSGAIVWKTYTVPEGYSGGAVWGSTPVVDTKRRSLYITTGNNYTVPPMVADCVEAHLDDPATMDACLAPDDYLDAVVALDLDTGAIRWGRRLQGFDAWTVACFNQPAGVTWCPSPEGPDYDFGSGANLFTVGTGPSKRDLLGAGQKSGVYWALDPDDGNIVWSTLVGPGSTLGGIEWGSATDGQRVYVAITNADNQPYNLSPSGESINWGSFAALDAKTGTILWQVADPAGYDNPVGAYGLGAVSVANGVMFAESLDPLGHMYAFDAASGEILWSFASGGSSIAGAAVVKGTVYWGSGYGRFGIGTPNNKLYAFGVSP